MIKKVLYGILIFSISTVAPVTYTMQALTSVSSGICQTITDHKTTIATGAVCFAMGMLFGRALEKRHACSDTQRLDALEAKVGDVESLTYCANRIAEFERDLSDLVHASPKEREEVARALQDNYSLSNSNHLQQKTSLLQSGTQLYDLEKRGEILHQVNDGVEHLERAIGSDYESESDSESDS